MIVMVFSFVACAQKGNVSQNAKEAFTQKFPNAENVSWDKENNNEWEAEFKMNGLEYSANYSENGDWLETESEIATNEVPNIVSQAVASKYPEAKINKVFKVERKDGISYEYEFKMNGKTQEVVFDSSGNMTKQNSQEENGENEQEGDD